MFISQIRLIWSNSGRLLRSEDLVLIAASEMTHLHRGVMWLKISVASKGSSAVLKPSGTSDRAKR